MAGKDETRVPMRKVTRNRLRTFCDGASLDYDTMVNMMLDDIERKYGDDLFIAGQEYRRIKREQGKANG